MRWRGKNYQQWHPWFAWRPIRMDSYPFTYVWLETVWRREVHEPGDHVYWEYVAWTKKPARDS